MKKGFLKILSIVLFVCLFSTLLTACEDEPLHTHVFDKEVAESNYLVSQATCKKKTTYYYSCQCGAKGDKTFEVGEFGEHNIVQVEAKEPESCEKGKHGWKAYEKCTNCDYTTYEEITVPHVYDGIVCTVCGNKNEFEYEPIYNEKNKKEILSYNVKSIGTFTDLEVVIPATYKGKPVLEISSSAFIDTKITSVVIEQGITKVGAYAFYGCKELTRVTIPDSVKSIGVSAFSGCSLLKEITLSDDIVNVGQDAFTDCGSLEYNEKNGLKYLGSEVNDYLYLDKVESKEIDTISIDENCKVIGFGVFSDCVNVTNIVVPNGIRTISSHAFYGCTSLKEVVTQGYVQEVGLQVFFGCPIEKAKVSTSVASSVKNDSLSEVEITSGTILPFGALFESKNLEKVKIGDSVKTIETGAFYHCLKLSQVEIANGVESIGDFAFFNCLALTTIEIPDSVTHLGKSAFAGCSSLQTVTYTGTVEQWGLMTKEAYWYINTPIAKVICSDGEVTIG